MLDHGPRPSRSREKKEKEIHRATRPRSYAIDKVWEAVTSRCLGKGRSDATCKQYGGVSASYKQFSVSASYKQYVSDECTYNIQSHQKHNMLSLLHAACLKLLVFFPPHKLIVDDVTKKFLATHATPEFVFMFTRDPMALPVKPFRQK